MGLTRIFIKIMRAFADSRSYESKLPSSVSEDLLTVKVLRVLDGDTVDVLYSGKKVRIRLYGIDCPEDGQAWGETAKAGLIKLIGGRTLYLEIFGIDHFGRTLATIYVKQGLELVNANELMVMRGHAWVLRQYYGDLSKSRRHQLNRLERWAKLKRVGLWRSDNPIPPWLWRKQDSA